jgi:hypothetical protein
MKLPAEGPPVITPLQAKRFSLMKKEATREFWESEEGAKVKDYSYSLLMLSKTLQTV